MDGIEVGEAERAAAFAARWIVPLGRGDARRLELYEHGGWVRVAYYVRRPARGRTPAREDRYPAQADTLEKAVRLVLAEAKEMDGLGVLLDYLRATERGSRFP